MLIRRRVDASKTDRSKGRQVFPNYTMNRQEVMLDPWEDDDCAFGIAEANQIGPEAGFQDWVTVAAGMMMLPPDQQFVRIMEDPQTGYVYFRRPIDIERQQLWNSDRAFRVSIEEWAADPKRVVFRKSIPEGLRGTRRCIAGKNQGDTPYFWFYDVDTLLIQELVDSIDSGKITTREQALAKMNELAAALVASV